VAAIVETVQRRGIEGKPTFLTFIDLAKAYDTVPHEALFAKMERIGIKGRMLGFIRSLYASSEICLRIQRYEAKPFMLRRGLRQGCPMSPILFDIFINDIYGEPGEIRLKWGVSVPGVSILTEGRMAGLLFADDLVGLSETPMGVRKQTERISEWCRVWEMGVGIKKCGVMCMEWGSQEVMDMADLEQIVLEEIPPTINGDRVPVVNEYVYLGVVMTKHLDFDAMVNGRCKKAEKVLYKILPMLKAQNIPVALRVSVLRTTLISTLLYGSEVWGMNDSRCAKAQSIVNKALRAIMGCKREDMTQPMAATWRELNVAPVCAMATAKRARAIKKFPGLKTWIGTLAKYDHEGKSRKRAWIASSRMWMKKYYPEDEEIEHEGKEEESEEGKRSIKVSVVDKRLATYERTKKGEASWDYLDDGFGDTAWASLKSIPVCDRPEQVRLGRGLCMLSLCRTGGLWTARKRAERRLIALKYMKLCPCCGVTGGEGENIEHLLMECQRWEEERQQYMGELIRGITVMGIIEQKEIMTLLLGGECNGRRVASWLPSIDSEAITCGAFQVARFLRCIRSERATILRQIKHKDLGIRSSD